ncbi:MAG: glucoamylase family protein [Bacteroidota bacterium]
MRRGVLVLLGALLAAAGAAAQTVTPIFAGDDPPADGVYTASEGGAVGNASLGLVGPNGRNLPTEAGGRAGDRAVLAYQHGDGGSWSVLVGAPGFGDLDLTEADSLVLVLNAPAGVPGVALPRIALEDADGDRTVGLPLDFGTRVGFDRVGSGFVDGSDTDLAVSVRYLDALPEGLARPGYPESLRLTFADDSVAVSTPSIGVPARPAHFTVATEAGLPLAFQFRDTNGDGTLSQSGEYVDVLTEDPATGRLRPTWRVEATGTPASAPDAGDVYRLGVFNGGVDGDPATWQRRAVALADFGPLGGVDLARIRGVRFENPEATTAERTLWFDALDALAYDGDPAGPPPPTGLTTEVGNETVLLQWTPASGAIGAYVYRSVGGGPFERITPSAVRFDHFFDLDAPNGAEAVYVLRSLASNGLRPPLLGPDSEAVAATAGGEGDPYIEALARRAFDFFWLEANPANGLIKDRSTPGSASSIASVGFGLSAITVGIDQGWITRAEGAERVRTTLDFFATCPQGPATSGTCGHRGFFYHFLNMQTGVRNGTNELSTIDTALLLGGVLHAAQYFDGGSDTEAAIRTRADQIWRRVEWDWAAPNAPLVALGWNPESGFIGFDWRGYNEAMILYILGLGSPTHPLPDGAWDGWTSTYRWQTHYGLSFVVFPPLFGHQYSHVWIDFRYMQDTYMRGRGITYFENSRRATLAQRAYAIANPGRFPNYAADEWGITASDIPGGYRARGAPPAQNDDGTLVPTAPGGSYVFTPELSREALRTMYRRHYARLWGPYGLKDAYNIEAGWTASDYIGIDQGPILLMIENHRTEAVWRAFMAHPDIRAGLARAGFDVPAVGAEAPPEAAALTLGPPAPNPASGRVALTYVLPAAGPARITVHDALGREVAVVLDAEAAAGSGLAEFDASGLAAGVYLVRLGAGGQSVTRPLVVTR